MRGSDRRPVGADLPPGEREDQYSPSSRLPNRDLVPFLDAYRERSDEARRRHPPVTITYGPEPTNTIDLALPPAPAGRRPSPLHVFIHGGYWQQLSKLDSYFLASACLDQGGGLAAVDYTLAPAATVDEIVDECCAAIRAIRERGSDLGLDRNSITVSGSSAGAHLAAMATLRLEPGERPASLVLVSGVYLLEPLIGTSINQAVGLDARSAAALSPLEHDLDGFPPTVVAWGENEPEEFKRQSRALVDELHSVGTPVGEHEVAGRNHFDVVFDIVPDLVDLPPR